MSSVRQPVVAGMFYPQEPEILRRDVLGYLGHAHSIEVAPKAIIAPHAGYIYSAPIAASVYNRLRPRHDKISRVILLGPSHRVGFNGLALSSAEYFATPLGYVPVDHRLDEQLCQLPQVSVLDQAHSMEHSLEVHLPFLQTVLDEFTLLPMVVGDATPEEVAQVLELLWGGEETLIVISSDLSHYQDYVSAQHLDQATSQAIEELRYEDIHYDDACGRNPIRGLLYFARTHQLHAHAVDVRNSGDTQGDKSRVVGYGAYVVE